MTSRLRRKRQTTARSTLRAKVFEHSAGGRRARPAYILILLIAAVASSRPAAADEAADADGWMPAKKAAFSAEPSLSRPAQRADATASDGWRGVGGRVVPTSATMLVDEAAQGGGGAFADPFEDGPNGKVVAAAATSAAASCLRTPWRPNRRRATKSCPRFKNR